MATTGIAHGRKLHVPGNVQVIGGDAFELIRNRSGLRFRSNPAHYCPDNVTDFALSGCEDGVAGDIDCPTISPSVISTAVLRTLEFLSYSMRSTPQDRYPDYYQAMLAICRQQSGLVPSSERTGRGALANPPAGSPWQPVNNIPPVIWWNNLERILLAVDDLGCRDLL